MAMNDLQAPQGKILNRPKINRAARCHFASFLSSCAPLKNEKQVLSILVLFSGFLSIVGILSLAAKDTTYDGSGHNNFSIASVASRIKKSVSSVYEIDSAYLASDKLYSKVKDSLSKAGTPKMLAAQPQVVASNLLGVSAHPKFITHFAPLVGDKYQSYSLVERKLVQVIKRRGRRGVDPDSLAMRIIDESKKANFDPLFVAAVIKSESAFDRFAVSSAGARGLMQILPSTGSFIAGLQDFKSVMKHKLTDPNYNVQLGIAYLKYLEQMYKGNRVLVLTAYNWGPGRVQDAIDGRRKIPAEVMSYALKILKDHQEWVNELMMAA